MRTLQNQYISVRKLFYTLVFVTFFSCTSSPEAQLQYIDGYWEIVSVRFPDDTQRTFSMSQNIDFFEINDNLTGVRKKVQPDLLGSFTTSQSSENINAIIKDNILKLQYSTAFDNWHETVIKATAKELVLLNENGNTYTYRRYEPILSN